MAGPTTPPPEDQSVWQYNPSLALAILASILYGIIFLVIFYQTFIKYRSWYFTCVVVGAGVEVAGYALRCHSIRNPSQVAPFATTLSLIVLAPILISAGNYLLLGRMIRSILLREHYKIAPGLPAHRITRIFVISDILSGMVQSSGSGVASSDNWTGPNLKVGINILIGGLGLQAVSFVLFMSLLGRFHYLARREAMADAPRDWRKLLRAVYISSAMILIRCIFRAAEFGEGVDGYSFRHEWLFWVFEAVPMLVAISVFCVHHPSAVLGRDGGGKRTSSDEEEGEELEARRRRHRKTRS
ncbi:RTA1 like protein-domain-containing protein [Rhypophila decipiens]|uniref:RTA1 like protein-domain-containing protein n=1 Tax=Rhypophila decipiens TaxID=261697 RepID=A0AAN7BE47_9PEZI|nr:RTA1 like protein-domain-containing protein [Rhypophila decipiens]